MQVQVKVPKKVPLCPLESSRKTMTYNVKNKGIDYTLRKILIHREMFIDNSFIRTSKTHQFNVKSYGQAFMLELAFDDTFVKTYQWSSILQAYSRVLHDQDFPKRVAMVVFCNI